MKNYTSAEYEKALSNAENDLRDIVNKFKDSYKNYLIELNDGNQDFQTKLRLAFQKKYIIQGEILEFISNKYPETDKIERNGIVMFSMDTIIHLKLLSQAFKTQRKFDELYKEFEKKIYLGLQEL